MNRQEFIAELRRAMSGGFSKTEIEEAVSYYEDYIDMQMKKGKREDEILRELGSPRLIAKSMKAAGKGAGTYTKTEYGGGSGNASYETNAPEGDGQRMFRIPLWLVLLIVLFILLAVLSLVFRLLVALLPIILIGSGIVMLYRYFQKK